MIYLIGGASRSGKSIISRKLMLEQHVSYFSADVLMMGLEHGAPQLGVRWNQPTMERSPLMWPILKGMIQDLFGVGEDYSIEGDCLLPSQVAEIKKGHPEEISMCFTGYVSINPQEKLKGIRAFHGKIANDWLVDFSDEDTILHIKRMKQFSKYLQKECKKYDLLYFDESEDFDEAIGDAYHSLVQK